MADDQHIVVCEYFVTLSRTILGKKVKSFGDVEFYHPHGVADKITMDGKNVVSVGKEGTGFAIVTESLFLLLLDTFILLIGSYKNLEF